ncbi:BatA domain-containing protein [Lysobacter sp. CA199]|uniref:BatA domain-containing protein n=1 Tax=Lysobacter sp. CA199 TaxID=3455608 RepID=UPI003F8D02AB
MTPVLLLPIALAALAALIVPLLIHLARRSEQRPTDFAALRWLRQRPKPRHRIRFDEWPLLLLRLILLTLLALLLAQPALFGAHSAKPWAVVWPGADAARARAELAAGPVELRWLAPGFPALSEPPPAASTAAASVLRELDANLPAGVALTVYLPSNLHGVDGERLRLSRPLQWRISDVAATDAVASAPRPARVSPQIRYAPDRAAGRVYLQAALAAWSGSTDAADPNPAAPLEQAFDRKARALIWLAPDAVPESVSDWVEQGGRVLLDADSRWPGPALVFDTPLWRDASGQVRVEGAVFGRGQVLRFTGPLSPRAWPELSQPGFAQRFGRLFEPPAPAPARVRALDYAPATGGPAFSLPPLDLAPWLALLIASLFLLERWLATRSRRGGAP